MPLELVTINGNGLRDNRKRELVFSWLVLKKYDCICLQETQCTGVDINRWKNEWKTQGGVASVWLCRPSESVTLNSVRREIVLAFTIVSYNEVRGRYKAQR